MICGSIVLLRFWGRLSRSSRSSRSNSFRDLFLPRRYIATTSVNTNFKMLIEINDNIDILANRYMVLITCDQQKPLQVLGTLKNLLIETLFSWVPTTSVLVEKWENLFLITQSLSSDLANSDRPCQNSVKEQSYQVLNFLSFQHHISTLYYIVKWTWDFKNKIWLTCSIILFGLILYIPSTIFQLNGDGSFWVEPVLS